MTTLVTSMKERRLQPAPPFTILGSLLVWGWQNEFLLFAVLMGVILELPHFTRWRINLSDQDINQIVDLSGVVFFLAIIYVFINYGAQGIYKTLELLPFALFLVLLTQRYNPDNTIKTSSLFISIRRLGKEAGDDVLYDIDISMPYVFLCLISASAGHKNSELFFLLCVLVTGWLLWYIRPRHFPVYRWLLSLVLVVTIAFVTQFGIKNLHRSMESFVMTLFDHYGWRSRDPERAMTAIGSLGRLKLSDTTIVRVQSEADLETPLYLKEVSYSRYEYGIWSNPPIEFELVQKQRGKKFWPLSPGTPDQTTMDIGLYMQDQSAIIPAPVTINSLFGQDIVQIDTNYLGALRIDAREGWVNFRVGLGQERWELQPPTEEDRFIFDKYKPLFQQLASELDLYDRSPREVIATVKAFFADNFYYSLTQNQRYPKGQYLEKFLFENRQGHCEYFATATALLLREAGIPARYTVGYVMSEYSNWQDAWLVRGRDAHSWVEYYSDGQWQRLDTTPSIWAPLEAEDSIILEPVIDIFSWLRYKLTSEDIEGDADSDFNFAWLLIPLILYLAWSLSRKQRLRQDGSPTTTDSHVNHGDDSPVYGIIERLEQQTDKRKAGETLTNWIKRVLPEQSTSPYMQLIAVHNNYRFNPAADKQVVMDELLSVTRAFRAGNDNETES